MLFKLRKRYAKSTVLNTVSHYEALLKKHDDPSKAVGWFSQFSQNIRFTNLSLIADLNNTTVLDAGSGLGDLFGFLDSQDLDLDYLGIDNCLCMIQKARSRFPGIKFQKKDFRSMSNQSFEYVLASGLLSHRQANPKKQIIDDIYQLFSLSKRGLAFNVLSDLAPAHLKFKKDFDYHSPSWLLTQVQKMTPYVCLYHHYLPNDFTIHMFKD